MNLLKPVKNMFIFTLKTFTVKNKKPIFLRTIKFFFCIDIFHDYIKHI